VKLRTSLPALLGPDPSRWAPPAPRTWEDRYFDDRRAWDEMDRRTAAQQTIARRLMRVPTPDEVKAVVESSRIDYDGTTFRLATPDGERIEIVSSEAPIAIAPEPLLAPAIPAPASMASRY